MGATLRAAAEVSKRMRRLRLLLIITFSIGAFAFVSVMSDRTLKQDEYAPSRILDAILAAGSGPGRLQTQAQSYPAPQATAQLELVWHLNVPTSAGLHTISFMSNGVRDCYILSPVRYGDNTGDASISCVNRP
jgi:hypothetical protein